MSADKPENDQHMPLVSHLTELRTRLLRCVAAIFIIFAGLFAFTQQIYTFVSTPLRQYLPAGATMIATDVSSPFLTPLKLTMMVSLFLAIPVILHQIWGFIAPGLYKHEKRIAVPLLVSSILLFYTGMAFAYFLVFPLIFKFFAAATPAGVEMMTDISSYLDFVDSFGYPPCQLSIAALTSDPGMFELLKEHFFAAVARGALARATAVLRRVVTGTEGGGDRHGVALQLARRRAVRRCQAAASLHALLCMIGIQVPDLVQSLPQRML